MIPTKKRSHAVKRSKFTEQQIAYALKQAELGTPVEEVCRKMGISDATFYNWKLFFGGLGPSEERRLKQLEEENTKLKKLVADLSLDKAMLLVVLSFLFCCFFVCGCCLLFCVFVFLFVFVWFVCFFVCFVCCLCF